MLGKTKNTCHHRRNLMRESLFAVTITAGTMLGLCAPSLAQENADQKLGTVHFSTSCSEPAQRRFYPAMRYPHSSSAPTFQDIYERPITATPQSALPASASPPFLPI